MAPLARDLLSQIKAKGRPCGIIINRQGVPTPWPVIDARRKQGVIVDRFAGTARFVGVYSSDCPVEWLADDLAAEWWQVKGAVTQ